MRNKKWLLAMLALAPCVTTAEAADNPAARSTASFTESYTLHPGDVLAVSVWKEPDLEKQVIVRPDGGISFPLVGEVDTKGKSVADLTRVISDRLRHYISDPVVTVSVQELKGNKVYVIGQVNKPGEYVVTSRVNVMQALSMAGGTTPFAALGDIKILRNVGPSQLALPFSYSDVLHGRRLDQNVDLTSGDVIVVP